MGFVSVVKLAFYFYDAYLHNEFYNQSVIFFNFGWYVAEGPVRVFFLFTKADNKQRFLKLAESALYLLQVQTLF